MAKRPRNIHDTFVRESFSDPKRSVAFFKQFLPKNLMQHFDFETFKVIKESYINETLQEHFSDLVFEVSITADSAVKTDVVLLFEHKSSPDRNVLIQVGHYMFAHWAKCLSEKKDLKPIIPVIYFQSKKSWKVGNLSDLFKHYPEEIKYYLPIFKHIFIDLKTISEDQLLNMRNSMMAAAILAQQWRINPAKLQADFEHIFRLFQLEGENMNFLEMIVVYSLHVSDIHEDQLGETIKSIPEPIKENIMNTYNRLMEKWKVEGEQLGIQKGEQIGLQKGKVDVILSLYDEGFETSRIAKIVKMPDEEVTNILKNRERLK